MQKGVKRMKTMPKARGASKAADALENTYYPREVSRSWEGWSYWINSSRRRIS